MQTRWLLCSRGIHVIRKNVHLTCRHIAEQAIHAGTDPILGARLVYCSAANSWDAPLDFNADSTSKMQTARLSTAFCHQVHRNVALRIRTSQLSPWSWLQPARYSSSGESLSCDTLLLAPNTRHVHAHFYVSLLGHFLSPVHSVTRQSTLQTLVCSSRLCIVCCLLFVETILHDNHLRPVSIAKRSYRRGENVQDRRMDEHSLNNT